MEVNLGKIREVFDKAPLGYYLKREISANLSKHAPTSYYDPTKDEITIAINNITTAMSKIGREPKDDNEYEELVRAPLYHEVSHAIITPNDRTMRSMSYFPMTGSSFSSDSYYIKEAYIIDHPGKGYPGDADVKEIKRCGDIRKIFNIIEDERIETIFNNYYMYVNFKKFLFLACDYEECKKARDTDPDAMFFSIVRFREGPEEFVSRMKKIISRARFVGRDNDGESGLQREEEVYIARSLLLYYDIIQSMKKDDKGGGKGDGKGKSDGDSKGDGKEGSDGKGDSKSKSGKPEDSSKSKDGDKEKKSEPSESKPEDEEIEKKVEELEKEIRDDCDEINNIKDSDSGPMGIVYNHLKKVSPLSDEDFKKKIEEIFDNYRSRTKRNGAAIDSYSGIFNVRNVVRDDYKYFRAANRMGHAKQYSKIHLNLFIDVSGSFASNQKTVNKILHELAAYEKKNPDFDFDLIWIGEFVPITKEGDKNKQNGYVSVEKRPKDKRYIVASGGNDIGPYVKQIFIDCQKPESENYNIVLFDGDAFSDSYNREESKKNLKAFDVSNCTIISDPDNDRAIKKYCQNAKIIITTNYVNHLRDNIEIALKEATRI